MLIHCLFVVVVEAGSKVVPRQPILETTRLSFQSIARARYGTSIFPALHRRPNVQNSGFHHTLDFAGRDCVFGCCGGARRFWVFQSR